MHQERTVLTTVVIDAVMNSRYERNTVTGYGPRIETTAIQDLKYVSYSTMPCRPTATRPTGSSMDPAAPDSTGLGVPGQGHGGQGAIYGVQDDVEESRGAMRRQHYYLDHWSRPHLPGVEIDEDGVWKHYPSVRWRPPGR